MDKGKNKKYDPVQRAKAARRAKVIEEAGSAAWVRRSVKMADESKYDRKYPKSLTLSDDLSDEDED